MTGSSPRAAVSYPLRQVVGAVPARDSEASEESVPPRRARAPPRSRRSAFFVAGSRGPAASPSSPTRWDYCPRYFPDEEINLEPSPLRPHRVRAMLNPPVRKSQGAHPRPAEKEGEREGAGGAEGAGTDRVEGAASVHGDYPAHSRCSISAPHSRWRARRAGGEGD